MDSDLMRNISQVFKGEAQEASHGVVYGGRLARSINGGIRDMPWVVLERRGSGTEM